MQHSCTGTSLILRCSAFTELGLRPRSTICASHLKSPHPHSYSDLLLSIIVTYFDNLVEIHYGNRIRISNSNFPFRAFTDEAMDDEVVCEDEEYEVGISSSLSENLNYDSSMSPGTSQASALAVNTKKHQTKIERYTCSKQEKTKIDHMLTRYVALSMKPYSTVEDQHFIKFVNALNSSYRLPSRKTLSTNNVPELFEKTRDKVKEQLQKVEYFSFTTDCWTSCANQPFIAVTTHFVNPEFLLQSACLGCYELSEDHTAENITDALYCCFNEWGIEEDKLVAFSTDIGANVVAAIDNTGKTHIPCFGHTVNTAVNDALAIEELKGIIQKIKKIQSASAHSWKLKRELNKCQKQFNLPVKKIPSFSKTRWWSLLHLMIVIVEQHHALQEVLQTFAKGKYRCYVLDHMELEILEEVISLLKPIEEISEHLSGEKYVTASCILPIYEKVKMSCRNRTDDTQIDHNITHIKNIFLSKILTKLSERYLKRTDSYNSLSMCTFLDPRFKTTFFTQQRIEDVKSLINEECSKYDSFISKTNTPQMKKKKSGLAAILVDVAVSETARMDTLDAELNVYINTPLIACDSEPLNWWRDNVSNFPRMAKIARQYLAIQATSVPSERVFSSGGNIVTNTRASLTGDHVEQLVFLAMNESYVP